MEGASVCIATYNGERFIRPQIESILSQLGETDEIIVSDDGSSDHTLKIINDYSDERIKIFNCNFKSPIKNFENALVNASGSLIFLADQDDVWLPGKLRIMREALNSHICVLSDARIIDEEGNLLGDSFYRLNGSKSGLVRNIIKNGYVGCAMAFRRELLAYALPFPRNITMHDWWLGLVAEVYGKTCFLEDILMDYRRHGSNASPTAEKSPNSFMRKVWNRLNLIFALWQRVFFTSISAVPVFFKK